VKIAKEGRRRVANCAHCDDYACQKLEGFFDIVPEAKTTLLVRECRDVIRF
jgi:hypothetical protein